jgi:hypothetical protein
LISARFLFCSLVMVLNISLTMTSTGDTYPRSDQLGLGSTYWADVHGHDSVFPLVQSSWHWHALVLHLAAVPKEVGWSSEHKKFSSFWIYSSTSMRQV